MRIYFKFDLNLTCKKILQEQLDKLGLTYELAGLGEVEIQGQVSNEKLDQLREGLSVYGGEIVENHKNILIQKIKDAIVEMVYQEDGLPDSNISDYLADKIGLTYGHISNIFSEITYTSIANFIILQKIERAKQLMITNEYTATQISWKLNYSSVAHFCTQFKNATGLTPTAFQRIINKRRNLIKTE